jgi:hypothetical protein
MDDRTSGTAVFNVCTGQATFRVGASAGDSRPTRCAPQCRLRPGRPDDVKVSRGDPGCRAPNAPVLRGLGTRNWPDRDIGLARWHRRDADGKSKSKMTG